MRNNIDILSYIINGSVNDEFQYTGVDIEKYHMYSKR